MEEEEEVEERNNSSSGSSAKLGRSCFAMTVRSLESAGFRMSAAAWRRRPMIQTTAVIAWPHRGTKASGRGAHGPVGMSPTAHEAIPAHVARGRTAAGRRHRMHVSGARTVGRKGGSVRAGAFPRPGGEAARLKATPDRVAGTAVTGEERPHSGTPANVRPWGRTARPHAGDGEGGHRHLDPPGMGARAGGKSHGTGRLLAEPPHRWTVAL